MLALGQRKRERLAALEAQAKTIISQASTQPQNLSNSIVTESLPAPLSTQSDPQNERLDGENTPTQTPAPELEVSKTGFNVDLFGSLYGDDDSMLLELNQFATCQLGGIEINAYDTVYSGEGEYYGDSLTNQEVRLITPPKEGHSALYFPLSNDMALEVPVLNALRAGLTVANLLGCANSMYDPFALRTLTPQPQSIPPNLQPTDAQQRIPHHPLLDIPPWPSVRTKLICAFSLPAPLRPPAARDSMAIMQIVFDIDDTAEGFRVNGINEFDSKAWEIGEAFFRNWWWSLDREVLENTNRLRARRGLGHLRLKTAA